MYLPTRLDDARDLALARILPKANTAHPKPPQETPRPAAEGAPVISPNLELGYKLLFVD